ncbi:hypothetical protein ACOMHN_022095 [Nucella lapillus]
MMEEEGDEMIAATMAHEIGHTLGALHDQQQNSCPSVFYTMAPVAGVPSDRAQSGNPFSFSSCSIAEMTAFVRRSEADCLRSRQSTPGSEVNVTALTTVPLGQQYTADQQCRNSFGPSSRFCRGLYDSAAFNFEADMCFNMRCQMPASTFCAGTLPFFGTSCGDGKSFCQVERLRTYECCASCSPSILPTTPAVTSPPGGGGRTQSNQGVTTRGSSEGTGRTATAGPRGMSVFGVEASTTRGR